MELRQKDKRDQGFTLIEVVVAITLAGLVAFSTAKLFSQSAFTQHNVNKRITALIIGAGKLAEVEYKSEQASSGEFPEPYKDYSWYSHEETGENDVKTIFLTVEWSDGRSDQPRQVVIKGYQHP